MRKAVQTTRCIYCGEMRSASKEHLIPKSLGGNLIARLVCKACNTGLGTIDEQLAEFSMLSLARVGSAAPKSFPAYLGGSQLRIDSDGGWEEIRVTNRLKPEILPQIHLVSGEEGERQISLKVGDAGEMRKLIAIIGERVADGTLGKVHVKERPGDDAKHPRIVLHRHKDLYVCAANKSEAEELLSALERNWLTIRQHVETAQLTAEMVPAGVVKIQLQLCLNDNFRAIAKIAYGLLAYTKGTEFALRSEFDSVRNYIRGIEVVNRDPSTPNDVGYDPRFVQWIESPQGGFLKTTGHSVLVGYSHPNLMAFVRLYEMFHFIVKLAEIELPEFEFEGYQFAADRSGHKRLDTFEIIQALKA